MGRLNVVEAEAEEIHHTLAGDMSVIDSKRHHLCILQGTMTGTVTVD